MKRGSLQATAGIAGNEAALVNQRTEKPPLVYIPNRARQELAQGTHMRDDMDFVATPFQEPQLETLSVSEFNVLHRVSWGYTNKEIAGHFGLSVKTIEGHKLRGMRKLGLRARFEVVRYALQHGWFYAEPEQQAASSKQQAASSKQQERTLFFRLKQVVGIVLDAPHFCVCRSCA